MIKSPPVPVELLAMSRMQRRAVREAGVALYLPAFDPAMLGEPAPEAETTADADFGTEAGGITIGYDEDDDFY